MQIAYLPEVPQEARGTKLERTKRDFLFLHSPLCPGGLPSRLLPPSLFRSSALCHSLILACFLLRFLQLNIIQNPINKEGKSNRLYEGLPFKASM